MGVYPSNLACSTRKSPTLLIPVKILRKCISQPNAMGLRIQVVSLFIA
jgi:hypothetical protein